MKSVLFPSTSGSDADSRQELAEVGLDSGRRLRSHLVVRIIIDLILLSLLNVELSMILHLSAIFLLLNISRLVHQVSECPCYR